MAPRVPVARVAGGRYVLSLEAEERRVMRSLVGQLGDLLDDAGDGDDPALGRLFPPLRPDDPAADAELRAMIRPDLEDARRRAISTVTGTLDASELDEPAVHAWLSVCNDLRLVLGSRLGFTGEDDPEPAEDAPEAWPTMVFHWLGWLVGCLVDVVAPGLPAHPDDASDTPDEAPEALAPEG